jgi:hypothetical protein
VSGQREGVEDMDKKAIKKKPQKKKGEKKGKK